MVQYGPMIPDEPPRTAEDELGIITVEMDIGGLPTILKTSLPFHMFAFTTFSLAGPPRRCGKLKNGEPGRHNMPIPGDLVGHFTVSETVQTVKYMYICMGYFYDMSASYDNMHNTATKNFDDMSAKWGARFTAQTAAACARDAFADDLCALPSAVKKEDGITQLLRSGKKVLMAAVRIGVFGSGFAHQQVKIYKETKAWSPDAE